MVARHPQIASIFDTMVAQNKVRYLKIDRGRYLYQRRIPIDLQAILDAKVWSKPCGDVSYSKAVQLVVTWADEHDLFIANLKSIEAKQDYATKKRRVIEKLFDNDGFLKWSGKIVPYEINKNNNVYRTAREQAKERLNISCLDRNRPIGTACLISA
jgi:hypothetical protein